MASYLNNLANMSIQKNTTIKNLVATNAMLTKAIADIQLSITEMCTAGVPTSPAPTSPTPMTEARVCPSHWSNTKPAWDKVRYCWTHRYKVKVGKKAPHAHRTRPAISPMRPGQTSWVTTLKMPVTLPPLHPPLDGAHQRTFISSPLLPHKRG